MSIDVESIVTPACRRTFGPSNYHLYQRQIVDAICEDFGWDDVPEASLIQEGWVPVISPLNFTWGRVYEVAALLKLAARESIELNLPICIYA